MLTTLQQQLQQQQVSNEAADSLCLLRVWLTVMTSMLQDLAGVLDTCRTRATRLAACEHVLQLLSVPVAALAVLASHATSPPLGCETSSGGKALECKPEGLHGDGSAELCREMTRQWRKCFDALLDAVQR